MPLVETPWQLTNVDPDNFILPAVRTLSISTTTSTYLDEVTLFLEKVHNRLTENLYTLICVFPVT